MSLDKKVGIKTKQSQQKQKHKIIEQKLGYPLSQKINLDYFSKALKKSLERPKKKKIDRKRSYKECKSLSRL